MENKNLQKILHALKAILLFTLAAFLLLLGCGSLPAFSGFLFIIATLLVLPINKWQTLIGKILAGKVKVLVIIGIIILAFFTLPQSPSSDDNQIDNTTLGSTETTGVNQPTTTPETVPVESTTVPSTNPAESTTPATEPSVPPTVVPTEPATEPTTAPTTPPSSEPTEESTAPVHTHSYIAATCTKPKTCSCGATEGNALGHNWKDATCTKAKTCSSCGVTEGNALGHSWKEANHTVPKTCSVCGATEGQPLEKPGKENYHGHVYTGGNSSVKYHYEDKCAGKYSHEITWEEVDKRNLEPCKTCVLK